MLEWGSIVGSLLVGLAVLVILFLAKQLFWGPGLVNVFSSPSIRGTWKAAFREQRYRGETLQGRADAGEVDAGVEKVEVRQFLVWVWGTIGYPGKNRQYRFRGTIRRL